MSRKPKKITHHRWATREAKRQSELIKELEQELAKLQKAQDQFESRLWLYHIVIRLGEAAARPASEGQTMSGRDLTEYNQK